jgi:hypothetical protein
LLPTPKQKSIKPVAVFFFVVLFNAVSQKFLYVVFSGVEMEIEMEVRLCKLCVLIYPLMEHPCCLFQKACRIKKGRQTERKVAVLTYLYHHKENFETVSLAQMAEELVQFPPYVYGHYKSPPRICDAFQSLQVWIAKIRVRGGRNKIPDMMREFWPHLSDADCL